MANYEVAIGHDQTVLTKIVPEPRANPVTPVERTYGAGGEIHENSRFIMLHWDYIEHAPEWVLLLEQFGLEDDGVDTSEVTIYAQNERLQWKYYNGVAQRPEVGEGMRRSNFFVRDVDMYIVDLEEFIP